MIESNTYEQVGVGELNNKIVIYYWTYHHHRPFHPQPMWDINLRDCWINLDEVIVSDEIH